MPLGEPIKLRLELGTEERVTAEAAARGMHIAPLLREKIDMGMDVSLLRRELDEGFHDLRERQNDFADMLANLSPGGSSSTMEVSAIYELLLLVRSLAGTKRITEAHQEMKRLGLKPYNPDNA